MQDKQTTIKDTLKVLARRKIPLGITAFAIFFVAGATAVLLPAKYISKATILIERQEIPQDLVRSVVTSFAAQRIYQISQRVMTNSNLTQIIDKYRLYSDEREEDPLEVVLVEMREDIALTPVSADVIDPKSGRPSEATIAFNLTFESDSPLLAQQVANELVSLFLQENLKERSETAKETSDFLTDEAEKLKSRVEQLESDLATFKENNMESLPELVGLKWKILDQTNAEIREVERQKRAGDEQLVFIEAELSKHSPVMNLISETGERILTASDRLKVLETEFLAVSARYGAEHPDVVRIKNEIRALRTETGDAGLEETAHQLELKKNELLRLSQKYSDDHPDVRDSRAAIAALEEKIAKGPTRASTTIEDYKNPNNPAYIQLNARREAALTDNRSLTIKKNELLAKRESIQNELAEMPQVEREFTSLTRGYENALAKYQEVAAKMLEAEVSENLESEQKGERFTLIEPPLLPETPAKPNRQGILFVGIVFAFLGGLGSAAVSEALDSTIRGRSGLIDALGVAPLAMIPDVDEANEVKSVKFWMVAGLLLFLFLLLGVFATSLYFERPIDVLWFQGLRKLGLG